MSTTLKTLKKVRAQLILFAVAGALAPQAVMAHGGGGGGGGGGGNHSMSMARSMNVSPAYHFPTGPPFHNHFPQMPTTGQNVGIQNNSAKALLGSGATKMTPVSKVASGQITSHKQPVGAPPVGTTPPKSNSPPKSNTPPTTNAPPVSSNPPVSNAPPTHSNPPTTNAPPTNNAPPVSSNPPSNAPPTNGNPPTGTTPVQPPTNNAPPISNNPPPNAAPPVTNSPPSGTQPTQPPTQPTQPPTQPTQPTYPSGGFPIFPIGFGGFGGGGYGGGGYGGGYGGGSSAPVATTDAPATDATAVAASTPADGVVQASYVAALPAPAAGHADLVLEDIHMVEKATLVAGPAYRVKLRNQGIAAADTFRVGIFTALDRQLTGSAAVVEVPSLAAGQTTEVTLRLPQSSLMLVSSGGHMTGFDKLVVMADVDQKVQESDKSNNAAVLDRSVLEAAE